MNTTKTMLAIALVLVLGMGSVHQAQGMQELTGKTFNGKATKALFKAIKHNSPEACAAAIAKGANVNAKNTFGGHAPLHKACEKGNAKIVKLLLGKGANVNARTTFGDRTPLHKACYEGYLDIVKLLVDKGADVNAVVIANGVYKGDTPLHYASVAGRLEIAKLLIDTGANVNAKDNVGSTPLHKACSNSSLETAKLLVACGAQVTQQDIDIIPNDYAYADELRELLHTTLHWDQVCRGKPVNPRQVQYLRNTPNQAIPLLLRPRLAGTVLKALNAYDQQNKSQVLQECINAFFESTKQEGIPYSEERMAIVALNDIKPHVVKEAWLNGLAKASESFKKRIAKLVAKLENLGSKLLANLKSLKGKGTEPDMGFGFDDTI